MSGSDSDERSRPLRSRSSNGELLGSTVFETSYDAPPDPRIFGASHSPSINCVYDMNETKDDDESITVETNLGAQTRGIPLQRAIFVVTNAALGAGMLNFPEAYGKTGGVIPALAVQTCMIVLIIGAFFILGYCCQIHHASNYQDLIRHFCGPAVQITCQIIVAVYMYGCNVTYFILIGDQLTKVIGDCDLYCNRNIVIAVVSCLFILPLCIPKKLKVISYSSLLGSLGALYVCLMVVSQYYAGNYKIHESFSSTTNFKWTHAFAAVPVICFGFQCHVTSVAVFAELNHPTIKRFGIVTISATAICAFIYSLTGAYGFLTFSQGVKSDVLVNYHKNDGAANAARAILVLVVFTTFAICHFVGRSAFLGLWVKIRNLSAEEIEESQNRRRVITTIVWFFSALGLSIVVPTIGKAIALVGGFAAHFIFTFPGLCLVNVILKDKMKLTIKNKLALMVGMAYVTIGFFLFGETVANAVLADINGKK